VGHFRDRCPNPAKPSEKDKYEEDGAKKAGCVNTTESDWDSESQGAWAAKEIDGKIITSSGASPSLGLLDLSSAGMLSDVAEPPLVKDDGFFEVADYIDQADDEWDSKDDLHVDFVVANDPSMEHENPEDIPQIFTAAADNTFSMIINGEMAMDVPHGTDISQLGLMEALDAPDVRFPPIPFSKLNEKGSTAAFSDVGCSI
jgi:hypothetical protein